MLALAPALASALAPVALAQEQPRPTALTTARAAATARDTARTSVRDEVRDEASWQFGQCMGGLTYGAPYKWALAYGMGFLRESPNSDWCALGVAKIGLGAAGFNVGVANSRGHLGSGAAVTAGVLRTFNHPWGASAHRTYVGASVHVWPVVALGGEIGWYTRLGADPAGSTSSRHIVTWSTGFGF